MNHNPAIKLRVVGMIDPFFKSSGAFRGIIRAGELTLVDSNERKIVLRDIRHPNGFKDGSELHITMVGGFFYARTIQDHERNERDIKKKRELQNRDREERMALEKNKTKQFNDEIRKILPFSWATGIKDVLTGLSANSDGSGRNSRTVVHVLLKEDVRIGRIVRSKGDFLCSRVHGKRWSGDPSGGRPDPDDAGKVSCKECLNKIESIKKVSDRS